MNSPTKDPEIRPPAKTFTQKEVAAILNTDLDSVFKRMMGGLDVLLQPSIFIKAPLKMQRTVSTGGNPKDYGRGAVTIFFEEELSGIFGIEGIRPLQWDECGLAQITFGEWPTSGGKGSSGILLTQGGYTYMLKSPLKIRKEELIVTEEDLLLYRRKTEGEIIDNPPNQTQTVEITVSQQIKKKTPDNTGRKAPYSLMTAITTCLDAFYHNHGNRKPAGKSAIGEFVDFIISQHAGKSPETLNIIEIKAKAKGKSQQFICLKAEISKSYPKGKHWHAWNTFESQFYKAMKNFTPKQPPAEKNNH